MNVTAKLASRTRTAPGNLTANFHWSARQAFQHCFQIKVDRVQSFLQTFDQERRLTGIGRSKARGVVARPILAIRAQTVQLELVDSAARLGLGNAQWIVRSVCRSSVVGQVGFGFQRVQD